MCLTERRAGQCSLSTTSPAATTRCRGRAADHQIHSNQTIVPSSAIVNTISTKLARSAIIAFCHRVFDHVLYLPHQLFDILLGDVQIASDKSSVRFSDADIL